MVNIGNFVKHLTFYSKIFDKEEGERERKAKEINKRNVWWII